MSLSGFGRDGQPGSGQKQSPRSSQESRNSYEIRGYFPARNKEASVQVSPLSSQPPTGTPTATPVTATSPDIADTNAKIPRTFDQGTTLAMAASPAVSPTAPSGQWAPAPRPDDDTYVSYRKQYITSEPPPARPPRQELEPDGQPPWHTRPQVPHNAHFTDQVRGWPSTEADRGGYSSRWAGHDSPLDRRSILSATDTTYFGRSSTSSSRHESAALDFPPMPPDENGPDAGNSLLLQSYALFTLNTTPEAQSLQWMPSMPPTPAPPTPTPEAPRAVSHAPAMPDPSGEQLSVSREGQASVRHPPRLSKAPVYVPPPQPVVPSVSRSMKSETQSSARFIAIGMDFGTTYSGVSWAISAEPGDIHEIRHYPHLGALGNLHDDVQVPSLYDEQMTRWGYQVTRTATAMKWFKLLLLRDEDIREDIQASPYLQQLRKQARQLGEDGVVDLVAAFLGQLWQHSVMEISLQLTATYVETLPFRVALTVPAIWKPYARTLMLEAARRARIQKARESGVAATQLTLVEEPEAAAVSTLLDRRELPDMAVGETCVVCDCGGGTIDTISYKLVSRSPFVICEAAGGDGKLCGSFLIDDQFEKHVKSQPGVRFSGVNAVDYQRFLNDQWEHSVKRSFSDHDGMDSYRLHLPSTALSRTARFRGHDTIVLDKDTVRGFFHETLQGIRMLIDEQYREIMKKEKKLPTKIFLVGGLGNSRYLYERLQNTYGNVLQPDRSWSSVARGAVIKLLKDIFSEKDVVAASSVDQRRGLQAMPALEGRIARVSYGVQTGVPVTEADPPQQPGESIIAEPGATPRVWRMQWYLQRGELMDNREPVSYRFFDYVRRSTPTARKVGIFTSSTLPPPRRMDATCRRLCTLSCEYDVPFDELPTVQGQPRLRVVQDIKLTMRFEGQPEWRLQVGNRTISEKLDVKFEG